MDILNINQSLKLYLVHNWYLTEQLRPRLINLILFLLYSLISVLIRFEQTNYFNISLSGISAIKIIISLNFALKTVCIHKNRPSKVGNIQHTFTLH